MPKKHRPLKVFLCHASQDKPVVRELSHRLTSEGWIDVWLDEKKLLPGQDWRLNIEDAVETSDIVIICLSNNSVSKEGFVQKELRYAKEIALEKPDETIFLIPLRLDNCEPPRGLRFYQWADYFGDKQNEMYDNLLQSLKLRYDQKLKIETKEKARKRKEKREAAEKIAREKNELEKEEREIAEKFVRKKLVYVIAEKYAREKADRESVELTKNTPSLSNINKSFEDKELAEPKPKEFETKTSALLLGFSQDVGIQEVAEVSDVVDVRDPKVSDSAVPKNSENENERLKDIDTLEKLLKTFDASALDDFLKNSLFLPYEIVWYWDRFHANINFVGFYVYDKSLLTRLEELRSAWQFVMSFSDYFLPTSQAERSKFLVKDIESRLAYNDYSQRAIPNLYQALEDLVVFVKEKYQEVDANNTSRLARKAFYAEFKDSSYMASGKIERGTAVDQNPETQPAPNESLIKIMRRKSNTIIILVLIGFVGTVIVGSILGSPLIGRWLVPTPTMSISILPVINEFPVITTTSTSLPPIATLTLTITPTLDSFEHIDSQGVAMRLIPTGSFTMGSSNVDTLLSECIKVDSTCKRSDFGDEEPSRVINLDAFYIDKFKVTNEEYKACVDLGVCQPPFYSSSASREKYYENPEYDTYPVIYVNWDMASSYCSWRGARLPTEAEWEKAARGINGNRYPWGEDIDCSYANYLGCVGDTTSVLKYSEKGASPFGVYDMAGNVWEWVADNYDATRYYSYKDNMSNPQGPVAPIEGFGRVMRGGSWVNDIISARSANRLWGNQNGSWYYVGFRCAKNANP